MIGSECFSGAVIVENSRDSPVGSEMADAACGRNKMLVQRDNAFLNGSSCGTSRESIVMSVCS